MWHKIKRKFTKSVRESECCEECLDIRDRETDRERERENAVGNWRKLPNQEYHDLCFSPDTVRVMNSMRIRGVTHLALTADNRIAYESLVRKPERNINLET